MKQRTALSMAIMGLALLMSLNINVPTAAAQVGPRVNPSVASTDPTNGATNVPLDAFVSVAVHIPNGGIDELTANTNTVKLFRTDNSTPVTSNITVSGGGDAITVTPLSYLSPATNYTFQITNGLKDVFGFGFDPYTITFTTGTNGPPTGSAVIRFEKVDLPGTAGFGYTSLLMGPDGKLYASTDTGEIRRFTINANGTLGAAETLSSLVVANGGNRLLVGMAFDPAATAGNLILWVSHTTAGFNDVPDWGGKITRLSGANLQTVQDYVINLPRSIRDHVTNSLSFGPDGALYVLQGGNSSMGDPDVGWGNRPERQLSAAMLRVNLSGITTPPLNAKTEDDGLPGSGVYDAFAPGVPLTIYASGIRNAYDMVWHTNGQLYVPTNGSSLGGNAPSTPGTLPAACNNRIDGPYTGPAVTGITGVNFTQPDLLFRVVAGGYYGHPNPKRCEWVLNGGNPTAGADSLEVTQYSAGTLPDRNWRITSGGLAFNFQNSKSPNGAIEYRTNFNIYDGQLEGRLMVVRYSGGDDIIVLTPGTAANNYAITNSQTGIEGFTGLGDPLDLIHDPNTGNIYVSEYGDRDLLLLRPMNYQPQIVVSPERHIFSDLIGGSPSAFKNYTVTNSGGSTLTVTNLAITGTDAGQYLLSPSNPSVPFTIPPGQSRSIGVAFNPTTTSPQIKTANLEVTSNSAVNPVATVRMRGLMQRGNSGAQEPSLSRILETFEIPVNVGDDDPDTTTIHSDPTIASGAPFGDEIAAQSFVLANTGAPATVEVLGSFANDFNPVTYNGYYRTGQPGNRYQVFTVNQGSHQTLLPATSGYLFFNPATSPFSFYGVYPTFNFRNVYGEDLFNTYDANAARRHKVRVYPMKNPNGTVEPNAYIFTYEELGSAAQTVWDYNDVVYIVRNITPAPTASNGLIDFENRDWQKLNSLNIPSTYWVNTWLSFNTIGFVPGNNQWANLRFHDEVTLRIHNRSSSAPLSISNMAISTNKYILLNPPTFPLVIPANSYYDQVVKFVENVGTKGSRKATLTITSDASNQPSAVINLGGVYMPQPEGANEVNVSVIADALGLKTNTLPIQQGQWIPAGEEVMSKYWQRLDPNQPIYIRHIGAFHGCCDSTAGITLDFITGTDPKIAPAHHPDYGQSLHPLNYNYPGPPVDNFKFTELSLDDRDDPFEIVVGGITACNAPCGNMHGVRWWPARDSSGLIVPGMYLVSMDYVNGGVGGTNYDYNDNPMLIWNVRPSSGADLPVDLVLSGSAAPDPVFVNNDLTYNFSIYNSATYPADGVRLDIDLPASAQVVSFSSPQSPQCTINVPSVTCSFGTLMGENTATLQLIVRPTVGPSITTTATAVTLSPEPNLANNTVILTNQVAGSNDLPGSITIVKQAEVESPQPFNFTSSGGLSPQNFVLVDDGSTPTTDIKINFQVAGNPVPTGYFRDWGQSYGARTDTNQGSGLTYGWVNPLDGTPLDLVGNGRQRSAMIDQRLRTFVFMQADDYPVGSPGTELEFAL